MSDVRRGIGNHPFFAGMAAAHLDLIAGCSREVALSDGQLIHREGEPANHFYLVIAGRVVVETSNPPLGSLGLLSVKPGEIFGFHWLFEPYRWSFDYRAGPGTRALQVDGRCLRGECEHDHELGYQLMSRFARVLGRVLDGTRQQLLEAIHEFHTQ